jgi:hypothetical protein
MPAPWLNCGDCGRFTPASVYTTVQCRLCWLHHHDPGYRAANFARGGATVPAVRRPCEYLRDEVVDRREMACASCWTYGCDIFDECQPGNQNRKQGVRQCLDCPVNTPRGTLKETVRIGQDLAPEDAVGLTAVVESLHLAHPGKFLTALDTTAPRLGDHHRRVVPTDRLERITSRPKVIRLTPLHVRSDSDRSVDVFMACCINLQEQLGVPVPLLADRPHLYLSEEERSAPPQVHEQTGDSSAYWLVDIGSTRYSAGGLLAGRVGQSVIDRLQGRIRFIQVGEVMPDASGSKLRGTIDLSGQTDIRQLMLLVYHAAGGMGTGTLIQHLCAAFERPYVLIASGLETRLSPNYPRQTVIEPCTESSVLNDTQAVVTAIQEHLN